MTQLIARCRHTGLIIAILLTSLSSGLMSGVAAQDSAKGPAKAAAEQNNLVPQQALPATTPGPSPSPEVTTAQTAQTNSATMEADMMTAAYGEVATALRRGGTVALTGLQSLPAAFSNSMQSLHEEQTGMKELSLTAAGAIVAGLATSAVFLMAFARLMPRLRPDRGLVAKVSLAGLRLAGDLLAVVIFVVLARNGAHMGMVSGSFGKEVTSGFIHIAMTTAIFASFGRLLFARDQRIRTVIRYCRRILASKNDGGIRLSVRLYP